MTTETEREIFGLRELSEEVTAVERSGWEPRCLMETFRREVEGEVHLTMQGWADLEAMRSRLLLGELPGDGEELSGALGAFELEWRGLSPKEGVELARAMRGACERAFGMALRMVPPERPAEQVEDGFGGWAPIWACLVTQCGVDAERALAMRVDRAQVLIATHRRNQGWQVAGTPYALRDLEEKEAGRE